MKRGKPQSKKVVVALSGGVDSSVAGALLKKEGFYPERSRRVEVIGLHFRFNNLSKQAEKRAQAVAKKLGIKFFVLDLRAEFKEKIIKYFLTEYKAGRTPNPCVLCNQAIKFKFLLDKMLELKADYVATGHYARIENGKLLKAKDNKKDQSYFLYRLKQSDLDKILFPVWEYTKPEVRKMARGFGLPTYNTAESQEVCFIQGATTGFLQKYLKQKKGDIVDILTGKKIGEHLGLWFYTLGQRKGIGLSGGPWFVIKKDTKRNILFVNRNEKLLLQKEVFFKNTNWLVGGLQFPLKAKAKIRYNSPGASCSVYKMSEVSPQTFKAVFEKPKKAPTPGQSIVFYKNSQLLGGGVISEVAPR